MRAICSSNPIAAHFGNASFAASIAQIASSCVLSGPYPTISSGLAEFPRASRRFVVLARHYHARQVELLFFCVCSIMEIGG